MRGLSDGERALLAHVMRWGSDGYPVHRLGKKWTWGTAAVQGPPTLFRTKREAVASFEMFYRVILDAAGKERQCACAIPDPVMQADGQFYCYTCSFETGARPKP